MIHYEDFSSAMRLAFDRGIPCTYEHSRERNRAFSAGRRALLEALNGPHICFMDDDMVLPGGALRQLTDFIDAHPDYGYLAPLVKNAAPLRNALGGRIQFTPGTVFRQDARGPQNPAGLLFQHGGRAGQAEGAATRSGRSAS